LPHVNATGETQLHDDRRPSTRATTINAPSDSAETRPRRRRRVLILPLWYPWPDRPGLGSFCREQARAVSLLHDVVVVTWRRDASLTGPFVIAQSFEDGLRTFRIQVRPRSRPRLETLITVLAVLSVVARLMLGGWRAHVVHAHEFQVGVPGIVPAVVSRAPLIMSEHWSALALGELPDEELDRARRMFRRAAVVSPVSDDLGRRIAPLTGTTPVVPVSNPVDTSLFVPGERTQRGNLRLLAVGNLAAVKGHGVLIDAMAPLVARYPDVSLDIVGDGDLRQDLEAQAQARGVESHVRFHGRLSRDDVARMMRTADVLVLPSLWETQGCVLLEATSSGLPVVASRVGGTPESVDASNGQLVEPGSPAMLVDGIVRVVEGLDGYDAQAMHRRAEERYGNDAVAQTWTDVYEAAIASFTRDCRRDSTAGSVTDHLTSVLRVGGESETSASR
jgi:glycosyltransferase involved in cell wall biosynthesis